VWVVSRGQLLVKSPFVGAFAKLRKAIISYVMAVRLSVGMEQLGSHWTDFHEISYLRIFFEKLSRKFKFH
jgi:hypothetical protein